MMVPNYTSMDFSTKVALITGGASGVGKSCVEELLQIGIKGIIIADINETLGVNVTEKFHQEYGKGRVIFIETNVCDQSSLENAFQKGVEEYGNLDILINCAGTSNEYTWENTLQINLFGTTYGCLLAINKYFPIYKSESQAFIININSVVGLIPIGFHPHYSSSKSAVIALTRSYGINKTVTEAGISVMAICPGPTDTPLMQNAENMIIYKDQFKEEMPQYGITQKPSSVAKAVIKVIREPANGRVLLVNEDKMYDVVFPKLEEMIVEIS